MRVVKWSPISHLMQESSIAPVWIAFPYLPVYCFDKSMLFALASAFGTPLKVDEPTANLTRPSVARILVEVDVSKVHKERIWIGNEKEGFYQRVVFENMPKYYQFCFKMGHAVDDCYVKTPPSKEGQDDNAPKSNTKSAQFQKSEVTKKAPVAKPVLQKYVPKIGVIEAEKGKATQSVSEPQKAKTDCETGTTNSLPNQSIDAGSNKGVNVLGEKGVCLSLTLITNTEMNSIPSNSSGSPKTDASDGQIDNITTAKETRVPLLPIVAQDEREKAMTFSSAPSSPSKGTKSRPLATIRFAHSDNDSGEAEMTEEDDEEEDEDFDEDPDYNPQTRNYDFYAYNSSKKGFRIGRLMGSSRR